MLEMGWAAHMDCVALMLGYLLQTRPPQAANHF